MKSQKKTITTVNAKRPSKKKTATPATAASADDCNGAELATQDGKTATTGCAGADDENYGLSHLHHMAWYHMLRAHAAVHRVLEQRLDSNSPATLAWYDVLVTLEKAPGGHLRMSELADNVMLSRSGLTRSVDKLEAAGMLQRVNCPNDRRGCYAAITEAGLAWRRAAWPGHARNIAELFGQHITDDEAKAMIAALSRVADAAGKNKE